MTVTNMSAFPWFGRGSAFAILAVLSCLLATEVVGEVSGPQQPAAKEDKEKAKQDEEKAKAEQAAEARVRPVIDTPNQLAERLELEKLRSQPVARLAAAALPSVQVFVDKKYGGKSFSLAVPSDGSTKVYLGGDNFSNDAISSIQVPDGYAVRGHDNKDGTGVARTYFASDPYVGDGVNDRYSRFEVFKFSYDDFTMAFASDTQYAWNELDNGMFVGNAKATAEATNNAQRDNITALANSLSSSQFAGVVINGDLTAYGHDDELDGYIGLWDNKFAYNIYPGLGNHDYKNNVNNCTENNCATRMYRYGRDTFQTLNALRFDYTEGDQYYKFPSLRKEFNGSLAYSWEIGPIHLVQLNYSPIYVTDWNGWDFSKARRDYYNIQKSIDWLKADLKDAVSRGKRIILNMHNWDDGDSDNGKTASTDPDFLQILSTYPVDAIFAGHIHSSCGWINPVSTGQKLQGPPVFRSGASLYKTFLMARFQSGKLTVQAVDGSKSPVQATVIYTSP